MRRRVTLSRPVQTESVDKVYRVQTAVVAARNAGRTHFDVTGEAAPGVRLVLSKVGGQARAATAVGHTVDLSQFSRSQSNPDLHSVLFDHLSRRRIHTVLHRLVSALATNPAAA